MDKYLKITSKSKEDELPDGSSPKRKRDSISVVWQYFKRTKETNVAICKQCGKQYKTGGNTTNLMDHLKRIHPDIMKDKKGELDFGINQFLERISAYRNDSAKKLKLDKMVMQMIAADVQPFNIVNDSGFRRLVNELDPRYHIPSKTHLRNVVLNNEYNELKQKVKLEIECVDHVAITTDAWTSKANEGYLTVTCHFINNQFEPKSAVLSTQKLLSSTNHTAANIADSLLIVFNEWGLKHKIVAIVTDNDASMRKACEILKIKNFPCFAHTLNLLVQDLLKQTFLSEILLKSKRIVAFFKSSTIAYEKFKIAQGVDNPYGLIQEVATRWSSAFQMLQRIVITNESISTTLLSIPKAPQPLSADEISTIKELVKILRPFHGAITSISADKRVTISIVIPLICELHKGLHDIHNLEASEAIAALNYVKDRLPARLFQYETRTITRIATIVDPRFKKEGVLNSVERRTGCKSLRRGTVQRIVQNPQTSQPATSQPAPPTEPKRFSFMKDKIQRKIVSSKTDAIILIRQHLEKQIAAEECNPLEYWKECSEDMLSFKNIAKKFLCVPASSCESERIFSKAGQIISERRCSLKCNVVNKLLFLNKNQKLFDL